MTGDPPFHGENRAALLRRIREEDPELPRRRDPKIPRDLQNISLKAMEKNPAQRYASARDMADDLRRFLAHEPVLAEPRAYSRLITGQVSAHLRDLESWRHDQIVSEEEHAGLRKRYERLLEREDAWILSARRLTLPQVSLYLGAWVLALAAFLLTFFPYPRLPALPKVAIAWGAVSPAAWMGLRTWRRGYCRVSIAYLLAVCLVTPVAMLLTLEAARLFTAFTQGKANLELFQRLEVRQAATNAQLWWSLLSTLPVCWWLRRFTRAPVFSLMYATAAALFCLATLLCMGVLKYVPDDAGRFYMRLIPCAVLFMAAGIVFERRKMPDDSRYFYPFAVVFTLAAFSGVVGYHQPLAKLLEKSLSFTHGQIEYLFMLNAGVYFVADRICDRSSLPQVRMVGKSFRFVIPGHILTSLFLLSFSEHAKGREALALYWLLPAAALVFVFASIPRQMKNFLVSGLVFLAIGVYRLQDKVFGERWLWPVFLLGCGLGLMVAAANYAPLRVALRRLRK
ncbi:MAG: hypothetical protein LAQ30_23345 [Acidobacteriia bacterium]|nr:hypothetical protein [Terriglobia bacterium]